MIIKKSVCLIGNWLVNSEWGCWWDFREGSGMKKEWKNELKCICR